MKHEKYFIALLLLVAFTRCNNSNNKNPVSAPVARNAAGSLLDSCAALKSRAAYTDLLNLSKKELAFAFHNNDNKLVASFAYFAGGAMEGLKQKDSAIVYYNISEQHAVKGNAPQYVVNSQERLSTIYYDEGMADSLTASKNRMEAVVNTLKDTALKIDVEESLAIYYATHNEPQKALAGFFDNLDYHKKQNDTALVGVDLNHIGRVYMQMREYKKSLQYSLEALPYLHNRSKIVCLNLAGDNYTTLGKPDSAVLYHKQAMALSLTLRDSLYLYNSTMQLCDALMALKKYDEVSARMKEALAYFDRSHHVNSVIDAYTILGQVERHHKNFAGAIVFEEKAIAYATNTNQKEWQTYLHADIAKLYDSAGRYKEAYDHLRMYSIGWDSTNRESNRKSIQEVETRYQTAQKEQQIKLLNQQALIKDIDLKAQRRTGWFLLAAFCLLLVIAVLIFRSYRLKRRSNALLEKNNSALNVFNQKLNEANQSKTKLFSIISHDLRSPVSSLFNYLQFEKKLALTETEEQLDKTRTRIKQTASDVLESMEDILFWSKSQMEHFEPNNQPVAVKAVFDEVISIHSAMADQKNITIHANCASDITITTDLNFLKIVMRNLLSNSIKFTPNGGNVYLTAQKGSNSIMVSVRDDGKGMTEEQQHSVFEWNSVRSDSSGLGLRLTKEFVDKLNASITTSSAPGAGTTFTVEFGN